MTTEQVETLAKDLEALAKERRAFEITDGFDPRTHDAAATAFERSATIVRKAAAR